MAAPRQTVIVAPVYVNGTAVVREMARKGARVVAVDTYASAPGLASRYPSEKAVVAPLARNSGSFARWLLARRDLYGALVIPTDDFFLRELYHHRDALAPHFMLCLPAGKAIEVCLDKALTSEAAVDAGVPIPRTRIIEDRDTLDDAAAYVGFPAIVKPLFSISFARKFATKVFRVGTLHELRAAFDKAHGAGERVLLQEVIPGPDSSVAGHVAYWDKGGNLVGGCVMRKLLQYPPLFGVGQVVTIERIPEVEASSTRFLKHIGYAGAIAATEMKYDARDGLWKLIEVNPRTPMQAGLFKAAGCDVLDMLWRDKLGLRRRPPEKTRTGARWVYLKNGLLRHRHYPQHRPGIGEYLRLYRPPLVLALLSVRDPRPFFADIWPFIRRRLPFLGKASVRSAETEVAASSGLAR